MSKSEDPTGLVPELKYCAFFDVLGYKSLVLGKESYAVQSAALISIYSNLLGTIGQHIREMNVHLTSKIYIRSGSDSVYLECASINPLMIALKRIFNDAFGFYENFTLKEERTPLLRCGVVRDWTLLLMDIGAATMNQPGTNPVGPGAARAYLVSEHSKISGMRIILSKEVMEGIGHFPVSNTPFPHTTVSVEHASIPEPYHVKKIWVNDLGIPTDLYELVWTHQGLNSCTFEYVEQLEKLLPTFEKRTMRHYVSTARIMLDGLLLTDCAGRSGEAFVRYRKRLEQIIAEHDPQRGFIAALTRWYYRMRHKLASRPD